MDAPKKWLTALVLCLVAVVVGPPPAGAATGDAPDAIGGAQLSAPAQPSLRRAANVRVVLRTPRGVPAQVVLVRGSRTYSFAKEERGRRLVLSRHLPSGSYRVRAIKSTVDGVVYGPSVNKGRVTIRSGSLTVVKIRMDEVSPEGVLRAVGVGASQVDLAWRLPRSADPSAKLEIRRADGGLVPETSTGVRIVQSTDQSGTLSDTDVGEQATYTYGLFVRASSGWRLVSSLTLTTPSAVPGGDPAIAVAPNAVVASSEDFHDTVRVDASGLVLLEPDPKRPALMVGSGVTLPVSDLLPTGMVGRVSAVDPVSGAATIEPGSLLDTFTYLDLDFDMATLGGFSADVPVVGTDTRQSVRELRPRLSGRIPGRATLWTAVEGTKGMKASCTHVESSVELSNLHVDGTPFGYLRTAIRTTAWGVPRSVSMDTRIDLDVVVRSDADVSISGECSLSLVDLLVSKMAGYVPVAAELKLDAALTGTTSVTLTGARWERHVGAWATLELGSQASLRGGVVPANPSFDLGTFSKYTSKLEAHIPGELVAGIGAGKKSGGGKAGAIAGLSGKVEFADASLTGTIDAGGEGCTSAEISSSAQLALKAEAFVDIPKVKWADVSMAASWPIPGASATLRWFGQALEFPDGCASSVATDPMIVTTSLPSGTVGIDYDARLETEDNRAGAWSVRNGSLPPGIELHDDHISGTPTETGSSSFTIQFEDGHKRVAQVDLSIDVGEPAALDVPSYHFRPGTVGVVYDTPILPYYVQGQDGSPDDLTWTAQSDSLPPGLSLVEQDGYYQVVGTPTKPGVYHVRLRALDGGAGVEARTVDLVVSAQPTTGSYERLESVPETRRFTAEWKYIDGAYHVLLTDHDTGTVQDLLSTVPGLAEACRSGSGALNTSAGELVVVQCNASLMLVDVPGHSFSRIDVPADGVDPGTAVSQPDATSISDDGRYVAFLSGRLLTPDAARDTATQEHTYLRDTVLGTTSLYAARGSRWAAFRDIRVSRDGNYVFLQQRLCSGPTGGYCDFGVSFSVRPTPIHQTSAERCQTGCNLFRNFSGNVSISDNGLVITSNTTPYHSLGTCCYYLGNQIVLWDLRRSRTTDFKEWPGWIDGEDQIAPGVTISGDGDTVFYDGDLDTYTCALYRAHVNSDGSLGSPELLGDPPDGLPRTGCTYPVRSTTYGDTLYAYSSATNMWPSQPGSEGWQTRGYVALR